jgi:hypothetical protein
MTNPRTLPVVAPPPLGITVITIQVGSKNPMGEVVN